MVPMALLGINSKNFLLIYIFRDMWILTHHSNMRFRLGIFGRLIATPQYHWKHHHLTEDGKMYNLGSFLTVWDYLFGTYKYMPVTTKMSDFKMGLAEVPGEKFNYLYSLAFPYLDVWRKTKLFPLAQARVDRFFKIHPQFPRPKEQASASKE